VRIGQTLYIKLFVTDGTAGGTTEVAGAELAQKSTYLIRAIDDAHFFMAVRNSDGTSSVYKADAATMDVEELVNLGVNPSNSNFMVTLALRGDNGKFYFLADTHDLWRSDGTPGGTVKLRNFLSINYLAPLGDYVYFVETPPPSIPGSAPAPVLKKIHGVSGAETDIKSVSYEIGQSLFPYNNQIVFRDRDNVNGQQIWISDGTAANTRILKDISEGTGGDGQTTAFAVYDGHLYFAAASPGKGAELWKSDGTAAGTTLVSDIVPGPGESKPASFAATGGRLYFTAYTPEKGFEVWSTDNADQTRLELDVLPGEAYSNPFGYVDLDGTLIFYAGTQSSGVQVWSSAVTTGVAEDGARTLTVYPNPSAGIFNVSLRHVEGASLAVFNATGQRVHVQQSVTEGASQVDLRSLPSGLYVFRCTTGSKRYTAKVIKQ